MSAEHSLEPRGLGTGPMCLQLHWHLLRPVTEGKGSKTMVVVVVVVVVVAFSSFARILGDCSIIHFPSALFLKNGN